MRAGPASVATLSVPWAAIAAVLLWRFNASLELVLILGFLFNYVLGGPTYEALRPTRFARPTFVAMNAAPTELAEHPLVGAARRAAPFATIMSATIALTGLIFIISDRCSRTAPATSPNVIATDSPTPAGESVSP